MQPKKIEFGVYFNGVSHPIYHYKELPPTAKEAKLSDMYLGRLIMYQIRLGEDKGDYTTDYVTKNNYPIIKELMSEGIKFYIKQS